jgi:hypothetical protein
MSMQRLRTTRRNARLQRPFADIVGTRPAQCGFKGVVHAILGVVGIAEDLNDQGLCTGAELSQFASHIAITACIQ